MWTLVAVFSSLIAVGSLIFGLFLLIFKRGRRRQGIMIAGFIPAICIVVLIQSIEAEARSEGWESMAERSRATEMGISDPAEFALFLLEEAEKVNLEKEASKTDEDRFNDKILEALEFNAGKREPAEPSGAHCLSPYDGASPDLVALVLTALKDPDSFEHVETVIFSVREDGKNPVMMTYRARNSFGGMVIESLEGEIDNASCEASLVIK